MNLKLKHSLTFFFAIVLADFLVFLLSGGESVYFLGGTGTSDLLAVPAIAYLLICYAVGIGSLGWLDKEHLPIHTVTKPQLPFVFAILCISLVLGVVGTEFFSIDASTRQYAFRDNPWLPLIILTTLPIAMMSIICARSWHRLILFFVLIAFYSLTGSRIHVMALILAMVASSFNRSIKIWHFVIGGILATFLLDVMASLRETAPGVSDSGPYLVRLFSSGHYSTFDIQTLLMSPRENFSLQPSYVWVAIIGPFRNVLGLEAVLSSSEYFTSMVDPVRYYRNLSIATVGLTGELYMIAGWIGALFVGVFAGSIALLKRLIEWVSGYNREMGILLRALGFLYLFLVLRSDMWIFFVYLWLQIPVLFVMAVYFAKTKFSHSIRQ